MTQLLLVRHGQSEWNAAGRIQGQADVPLDETGLAQAQRIAERLAGQPVAAIYASPLRRARITAEAIGARHGLLVECDARLMEYQFGVVSGLTWPEVVERQPEFARRWADDAWAVPVEGSEGRAVFAARVTAAMDAIVTRHPDQQVVVVAHGGTFNVYLAVMLGLNVQRRHPFRFGNASLSLVEWRAGVFHINYLNDQCHLADFSG